MFLIGRDQVFEEYFFNFTAGGNGAVFNIGQLSHNTFSKPCLFFHVDTRDFGDADRIQND